jgi:formate dehydrogenase maturation protein FdhE
MKDESSALNEIVGNLSDLRFAMQKAELKVPLSQMKANNEYTESMQQFLSDNLESLTHKRIEQLHEEIMKLNYTEKESIKTKASSNLERYLADFSLRSEDFYMKVYSADWQDKLPEPESTHLPFLILTKEEDLKMVTFRGKAEKEDAKMRPSSKFIEVKK